MFVALRNQGIISFRMLEKLLTSAFNLIEKRFSPGGLKVGLFSLGWILDIPKNCKNVRLFTSIEDSTMCHAQPKK